MSEYNLQLPANFPFDTLFPRTWNTADDTQYNQNKFGSSSWKYRMIFIDSVTVGDKIDKFRIRFAGDDGEGELWGTKAVGSENAQYKLGTDTSYFAWDNTLKKYKLDMQPVSTSTETPPGQSLTVFIGFKQDWNNTLPGQNVIKITTQNIWTGNWAGSAQQWSNAIAATWDQEITTSSSSSSSSGDSGSSSSIGNYGDPYIVTLSGDLFKMKNFNGYSRMIQGMLKKQLLTINIETSMATESEIFEVNNFVDEQVTKFENNNIDMEYFKTLKNDASQEAFMRKIYIQYGEESILIDMNTFEILEENSEFKLSNDESYQKLIDYYTDKPSEQLLLNINDLKIVLIKFSNPQIRSGFYIKNPELLEKSNGPMVEPQSSDDYIIDKINCSQQIYITNNQQEKKYKYEYYISNNGKHTTQKIYIM